MYIFIYIFEFQDESQTNLIQKFEFEPNQMVLEFEPCDLGEGYIFIKVMIKDFNSQCHQHQGT